MITAFPGLDSQMHLLRSPVLGGTLEVDAEGLLEQSNRNRVAKLWPAERRIDWLALNEYPGIHDAILQEVYKYDAWADAQDRVRQKSDARQCDDPAQEFDIATQAIYREHSHLQNLRIDLKELVVGKHILDIGGSCIDSWRFLKAGASCVHHVEISAQSQRVGFARCLSKFHDAQMIENRVFFHTSPAEFLPFTGQCFDLVFSRSSIHHTKREHSIAEAARVLKAEGKMLLIEPMQTKFFRQLTHFSRVARRADRGTDDPLSMADIELIESNFRKVYFEPRNPFVLNLRNGCNWILSRTGTTRTGVIFAEK